MQRGTQSEVAQKSVPGAYIAMQKLSLKDSAVYQGIHLNLDLSFA